MCAICAQPPCGLAHTVICECPALTQNRARAHHDLTYFATQRAAASVSHLLQRYVHLFNHHPLDQSGQLC